MDRFNSREDVEFDPVAFEDGRQARCQGYKIDQCSWHTDWMKRSWRAGWCDEDMSIAAELHA